MVYTGMVFYFDDYPQSPAVYKVMKDCPIHPRDIRLNQTKLITWKEGEFRTTCIAKCKSHKGGRFALRKHRLKQLKPVKVVKDEASTGEPPSVPDETVEEEEDQSQERDEDDNAHYDLPLLRPSMRSEMGAMNGLAVGVHVGDAIPNDQPDMGTFALDGEEVLRRALDIALPNDTSSERGRAVPLESPPKRRRGDTSSGSRSSSSRERKRQKDGSEDPRGGANAGDGSTTGEDGSSAEHNGTTPRRPQDSGRAVVATDQNMSGPKEEKWYGFHLPSTGTYYACAESALNPEVWKTARFGENGMLFVAGENGTFQQRSVVFFTKGTETRVRSMVEGFRNGELEAGIFNVPPYAFHQEAPQMRGLVSQGQEGEGPVGRDERVLPIEVLKQDETGSVALETPPEKKNGLESVLQDESNLDDMAKLFLANSKAQHEFIAAKDLYPQVVQKANKVIEKMEEIGQQAHLSLSNQLNSMSRATSQVKATRLAIREKMKKIEDEEKESEGQMENLNLILSSVEAIGTHVQAALVPLLGNGAPTANGIPVPTTANMPAHGAAPAHANQGE